MVTVRMWRTQIRCLSLILVLMVFLGCVTAAAASRSRYDWDKLVAAVDVESVEGRFLRGVGYANLGRLAEAFDEFSIIADNKQTEPVRALMRDKQEILNESSDDLLAMNVLAYGAYALKDYDLATQYFEGVIQADPENVWPKNFVALIYGRHGQVDKGLEHLREAAAIEPENQYTHLLFAVAYREQKQLVSAVYHYLRAPKAVKELKKHGID